MMMMNGTGGFSKFLLRDRNLVGNARVVVNRLVQTMVRCCQPSKNLGNSINVVVVIVGGVVLHGVVVLVCC